MSKEKRWKEGDKLARRKAAQKEGNEQKEKCGRRRLMSKEKSWEEGEK